VAGFWKLISIAVVQKVDACATILAPPYVYRRPNVYTRRVQPFAIAGRITFIYLKYGRQGVRVIFLFN